MKKILLLTIVFWFHISTSDAQSGQWIWMKGDSTGSSSGVFGTQGTPDPQNRPPAVYEPVSWTDQQGNFWLFGGVTYLLNNHYSALWKFDPLTNNWVWVSGPSTPNLPGVYGTQGIPDPNNNPGARAWGSASWVDSSGNLWMFAGYGYDSQGSLGLMNDLWKYDISSNEWTWMKGSAFINPTFSFGLPGIESPSNEISARDEAVAAWTGKNNYLWYFGGHSSFGDLNDMWRYNISTNNWTWMKGSISANLPAVYGTLGIADPNNDPGGRSVYAHWTDCDGNFLFYGGSIFQTISQFSDMWKYDPITNEFTWIGGTTALNSIGTPGNYCEFDSSFFPSARYENRSCWRDTHGNFWMFGGYTLSGMFNDLWVFSSTIHQWSLVSGSTTQNQNGFYGQQGVANPANVPAGKMGAVSWMGNDGNFWLFGGNKKIPFSFETMNDLWIYIPDSSCTGNNSQVCGAAAPSFVASTTTLCEKFCVDFTDQSTNNPSSWQWFFPGGTPATSTLQNPSNICYNNAGVYDVMLVTSNTNGDDTLLLSNYITVYSTPPIPVITQAGNVLSSSSAFAYQWQFNTVDIPGATNQSYTATQTGLYTVIISDSNGCESSSGIFVELIGIDEPTSNFTFIIYPNPSPGNFTIVFSDFPRGTDAIVTITNILGQEIFSEKEKISLPIQTIEINLSNAPPGVYFLSLRAGDFFERRKIILEK